MVLRLVISMAASRVFCLKQHEFLSCAKSQGVKFFLQIFFRIVFKYFSTEYFIDF